MAAFIFLAVLLASCAFGTSNGSQLKDGIRQARLTLDTENTKQSQFTYRPATTNPYVVVFLPAQPVTREMIVASDLPLEAKEILEFQVKSRSFPGPVLGFLESKSAEWHPLEDIVTIPTMSYVWKKAGEPVTVQLSMNNRRPELSALR